MTNSTQSKSRARSPEYPSQSLRVCVDLARKIYEAEGQNWTSSEVAVRHLGYSSLNGGSRTTLSAVRKFGLIEYRDGDLRITDLAMRVLVPKDDAEMGEALREALLLPKLYRWVSDEYPGWDLPSDESLRARLIRDLRFNPSATKGFIEDLKESLEYVKPYSLSLRTGDRVDSVRAEAAPQPAISATPTPTGQTSPIRSDGHTLSVPGASWFTWLPGDMDADDAHRMLKWVEQVLKPQLLFIARETSGVNTGE